MAIWGNYDASLTPHTASVPDIQLGIVDPEFFKGQAKNYEKLEATPTQPIELKRGIGIQKIQNLVYLVGSLTAYNSGDFKKSTEISHKINYEEFPSNCESVKYLLDWASIHWYLGDVEKSEGYSTNAMSIIDSLQCSLIDKAKTLDQLSDIYSSYHSRHEEAVEFSKQAIELVESLPGNHDSILSIYYTNLATTLYFLQDYKNGIEAQKKSLDLIEISNAKDKDWIIGNGLVNLAAFHVNLGEYETAIDYLKKGQIIEQEIYPKLHHTHASTLSLFSKLYWKMNDHNKAIEYQLEALELREKILPENHKLLVHSYHNIATLQSSAYIDLNTALNYEEKAIRITESTIPVDTTSLATMYGRLFNIYLLLGQDKKAKKQLDISRRLRLSQTNFNPLAPSMIYTHNDYVEYYFAKEDYSASLSHNDSTIMILAPYIEAEMIPKENIITLKSNQIKILAAMGNCKASETISENVNQVFLSLEPSQKDQEFANYHYLLALAKFCSRDFEGAMINAENSELAFKNTKNQVPSMKFQHARVVNLMAEIALELNEIDRALELNESAIEMVKEYNLGNYYKYRQLLKTKEKILELA